MFGLEDAKHQIVIVSIQLFCQKTNGCIRSIILMTRYLLKQTLKKLWQII